MVRGACRAVTRLVFAIPGDLSRRTGGYEYDRRLLEAAPEVGLDIVHLPLPGSFPDAPEADVAATIATINHAARHGDIVLLDGLACGALPEAGVREIRAPVIELCHHPLCLEAGLTPTRAAQLRDNEKRVFGSIAHVVVTSPHTARALECDFDVPGEKISVAVPGTLRRARAKGSERPLSLLAVGAIIPRKAFDVLVAALATEKAADWRLRIVGSARHSPTTATALARLIEARGLTQRVELLGECTGDALESLFDAADVFVSASLHEGYGMALAEALARGLPIVTTTGGAAAETVPDDAAIKIPPGDVESLRRALRQIMRDGEMRWRLSEAAWRAGQRLPEWQDAARVIAKSARDIARKTAARAS